MTPLQFCIRGGRLRLALPCKQGHSSMIRAIYLLKILVACLNHFQEGGLLTLLPLFTNPTYAV